MLRDARGEGGGAGGRGGSKGGAAATNSDEDDGEDSDQVGPRLAVLDGRKGQALHTRVVSCGDACAGKRAPGRVPVVQRPGPKLHGANAFLLWS